MNSEGYRTHRVVTGPMIIRKSGLLFRKIVLPEFCGPYSSSNLFYGPCIHCPGYYTFRRDYVHSLREELALHLDLHFDG